MDFTPGHPGIRFLVVVVAAVLLRWHLWRAWAFVLPTSIRTEQESPPDTDPVPGALEATHEQLKKLGFAWLGTRLEHPRFGKKLVNYDYAHAELGAFATLYEGLGGAPRLYFFTPTKGGGYVLTANFRRPTRIVEGRYLSGYLEVSDVERLLKAHARRIPELGGADGVWTMDGRLDAARKWFAGFGKAEVRQQNAVGLLWTCGAIGMVGAAIFGRST